MAKRTSVYLTDEAQAVLGSPDSLSGRINSILIRYAEICTRHRPALSRSEWCAVFDAINGCWLMAEHGQTDVARYIWAEVSDAPGLGEKWGIDQQALVEKLRGMSYAEQVSVVEHATRFWQLSELPTDDALAKIGIAPDE